MDVLDAIKTLRSVRRFHEEPVSSAEIGRKIEASIGALFEDEASFRASVDGLIDSLLELD
jgi:hypothetical protein